MSCQYRIIENVDRYHDVSDNAKPVAAHSADAAVFVGQLLPAIIYHPVIGVDFEIIPYDLFTYLRNIDLINIAEKLLSFVHTFHPSLFSPV
jgi:hypothetical protein